MGNTDPSAAAARKSLNPMVAGGHSVKYASAQTARNGMRASGLVYPKEANKMPQKNRDPSTAETGEQVPARPHDSGSAANETIDGLDATTEALRHAAEDTPSGAARDDVEKVPLFDRAGQAPKI
jgi:hypothetical protein